MARKLHDPLSINHAPIIARGREVVEMEAGALHLLAQTLDDNFVAACQAILRSSRHVVISGMGKSGHIGRKLAATFSATGTPSIFLHPAEAAHGDLGMLVPGNTLVVISNSGNTSELRPVLDRAKALGVPVIGIASRRSSLVMNRADIRLVLPAVREACAENVAPTTSTTLQLALGDALAMAVMDMRGVSGESLRSLHPGGNIGLRLTPVGEMMHALPSLPLIDTSASMRDAILAMSSGGFGIAGVVDADRRLIGVITDGDLRRHFDRLATAKAADIMTCSPKTLMLGTAAEDALLFLNEHKITAAFVVDAPLGAANPKPIGLVHIHDFARLGLPDTNP